MPLLKVNVIKGRSSAQIDLLLDTIHTSMVRSFGVPDRDRYQILFEHEKSHFRAEDTGLDIDRTDRFILLEVISRPRDRAAKTSFYRNLADDLLANCGIAPSDIMVSFVQNSDDDWSFGNGNAQFLTGEL